jgi:hypothetical protein
MYAFIVPWSIPQSLLLLHLKLYIIIISFYWYVNNVCKWLNIMKQPLNQPQYKASGSRFKSCYILIWNEKREDFVVRETDRRPGNQNSLTLPVTFLLVWQFTINKVIFSELLKEWTSSNINLVPTWKKTQYIPLQWSAGKCCLGKYYCLSHTNPINTLCG